MAVEGEAIGGEGCFGDRDRTEAFYWVEVELEAVVSDFYIASCFLVRFSASVGVGWGLLYLPDLSPWLTECGFYQNRQNNNRDVFFKPLARY